MPTSAFRCSAESLALGESMAGTFDVLAGARDMASAAARLRDGTYVELRGTHFIQMEQPEVVHQLLLDFLDQVG